MSFFNTSPTSATKTLRVLAHLLSYPDAELRAHLPELQTALHDERALGGARLAELDALITRLSRRRPLDVEADHVELFDRGRGTALHLFEHVHGDSRDRGPAMVDLCQTY
jgi:nitrate reductase delta subunit